LFIPIKYRIDGEINLKNLIFYKNNLIFFLNNLFNLIFYPEKFIIIKNIKKTVSCIVLVLGYCIDSVEQNRLSLKRTMYMLNWLWNYNLEIIGEIIKWVSYQFFTKNSRKFCGFYSIFYFCRCYCLLSLLLSKKMKQIFYFCRCYCLLSLLLSKKMKQIVNLERSLTISSKP
jgi:hypothetical protein